MAQKYFNEEYVKGLIFEYQAKTSWIMDGKNRFTIIRKDVKLENIIVNEIIKIVKAIIQLYRYYIFEPYDDCFQFGIHACYTNFLKFSPSKGTVFNYFSLITKRALLNYTDRKKKHRGLADIENHTDEYKETGMDLDLFSYQLKETFESIINENFLRAKRKTFLKIAAIITNYININKKFISKIDMYKYIKTFGLKYQDIKNFVNAMKDFKVDFFVFFEKDLDYV